MDLGVLTGVAVLCTTAPIALVVAGLAWRSRSLPGVGAFLVLLGLAAWWATGYAVELFVAGLHTKLVWSNLQYLAITFLPVTLLAMSLDYTGHSTWVTPRRLAPMCVIPLVTNVLLWVDISAGLVRSSSWLDTTGAYPVVGQTWGPWFWVHAGYSYLLLAFGLGLLVRALVSRPALHRHRLTAVLVGALAPVVASVVETTVPSSSSADDLTPAFFIISILILAWGLLRVRVFNLVPVARHALVENMRDGVLVLDTSEQVVDLNEAARELMSRPKAQLIGRPIGDCWPAWDQIAVPLAAGAVHAQMRLEVGDTERHYEVRASPLSQSGRVVAHLLVLSDITDRVLLENSLRDQALTDGLTGLPNRALFMARLGDAVHQAKRREGALFAVMVLDLDNFKQINDSFGHLAGDVLLQSVAAKIRRCVREVDTVARMGGDEFIVVLHEISNQRDLLPILARIRGELRTPVYFKQQEMTTTSSVGVVLWDPSYEDPEALVRAADTAMYQAKEAGRDCYRIFDEPMHAAMVRALTDETDLRAAIREQAFSLSYQPVVELRSGTVHSLEALLRWHHPERGTVFPRDFLGVAESSGLILSLGEIALDEACSQVNHWQQRDLEVARLPVRINVSPRQLTEPDFVPSVLSRLAAWKIHADQLVLEITEHALMRDPPKAKQAMKRLRGLGVRLCLDDFGAGSSSLQHLTMFPVQELKLDASFVSEIAPETRELEVIRHVAALAHTLGLEVTAEGVERAGQCELLLDAGCDLAQGYYLAAPTEADAVPPSIRDLERSGLRALLQERSRT